jgi:hypothetical protein
VSVATVAEPPVLGDLKSPAGSGELRTYTIAFLPLLRGTHDIAVITAARQGRAGLR